MYAFLMRLVFNVTMLERHISLVTNKRYKCTCGTIYLRVSPVSLLACIFSRLLSLALEQHASFQKNATETNASLMRVRVKFRLSCTVTGNS